MDANIFRSKKFYLLTVFPVIFLLLTLLMTLVILPQRTRLQNKAAGNSLSLNFSVPADILPGSVLTLGITANPPTTGIKITSTKIVINYPATFSVTAVTPGPFFTQKFIPSSMKMLSSADTSVPGKIILNYGAPCTVAVPLQCFPTTTAGIVASIQFQVPSSYSGTAIFSFDHNATLATALDRDGSPISSSVIETAQLTSVSTTVNAAVPTINSVSTVNFPKTGLVGYWNMDETSGILVEDSLKLNTGKANNVNILSPGIIGQGARKFNGISDYVSFNPTLGNFGTGDFTISFLIKTDKSDEYIFSKRSICNHSNFVEVRLTDGKPRFYVDQDTSKTNYADVWGDKKVDDGLLHHIVAVRKGRTMSIYTDGVGKSVTTAGIADINNSFTSELSANPCNLPFSGVIDEVGIWNRALESEEVTNLYRLYSEKQGLDK